MVDDIDRVTDLAERELESCIRSARCELVRRHGPYVCVRCGELNDRRLAGYAICSDCEEDARLKDWEEWDGWDGLEGGE